MKKWLWYTWQLFWTLSMVSSFLKHNDVETHVSRTILKKSRHWIMSGGRDSSAGITTRYRLDSPGIESPCGRNFLHPYRLALGPTQRHIQWVPGLFFLGVKWSGCGINPRPPSSTEVKGRVELYLPLWAFMACSRANFTWIMSKMIDMFTWTHNWHKHLVLVEIIIFSIYILRWQICYSKHTLTYNLKPSCRY
jgi:hypothetical protein